MRRYKLVKFDEQDKSELRSGKFKVIDGQNIVYIRISKCGIDHHPALPARMKDSYYPFASKSYQDRLDKGLVRIDVSAGLREKPITHYLFINTLEEIVGPSFVNLNIVIFAPSWLGSLINRIYFTIINYKH